MLFLPALVPLRPLVTARVHHPLAVEPPAGVVVIGPGSLDLRLIAGKLTARAGFATSLVAGNGAQLLWRSLLYGKDYAEADFDDPDCAQKQSAEPEHTARWMLLDKNRFSLSGLDCSQIGVGYSAFRNQPDRCEQKLGSCLDGVYSNGVLLTSAKIKDYYNDDLDPDVWIVVS